MALFHKSNVSELSARDELEIALKPRINESKKVQGLIQQERKACRVFGGTEIKHGETKNMATLCHRHRK